MKPTLKPGDTVRLTRKAFASRCLTAIRDGREDNHTSVIRSAGPWAELGGFTMERDLGGARHWNVEDLVRVARVSS